MLLIPDFGFHRLRGLLPDRADPCITGRRQHRMDQQGHSGIRLQDPQSTQRVGAHEPLERLLLCAADRGMREFMRQSLQQHRVDRLREVFLREADVQEACLRY